MRRTIHLRLWAHPRTRHVLDAAVGLPIVAGWVWLVLAYFGMV